jgi:uncharacterized protein
MIPPKDTPPPKDLPENPDGMCIGICTIGPDGYCEGCGRSEEELHAPQQSNLEARRPTR